MLAALGLGGCATKGFVRDQVAIVNQRVDGLEARLNDTDAAAKAAQAEARAASGQGQANTQRLDQLGARVDGLEQRMNQATAKRPRN
jgi:BMFP domain-containing protein YqiC